MAGDCKKSVKKDQNAAFQPLFGGVLLRILCMKKEENDFCLKLQFPALEVIVVLCIFYIVKKIRNALLSHSILWGNQTRKIAKSHFFLLFF